jgi:hypothetical protein
MEMILAILGCVTQGPIIWLCKTKHKCEKGTLKTYITAEMPAQQKESQETHITAYNTATQ